ncbi:MAG: 2-amino-4-hydroxy-6-hydroxymethyldihydropteridine diphosphokinase [Candidatus Krumholzibacteriia bacterium]
MALVALSLGSNIEPVRNLTLAVAMLRGTGRIVGVSRVYETAPVGAPGSAPFLNAAVLFETALDPATLKRDVIGGIERALGRVRDPADRNAPRTIDLDISLWEGPAGPDGPPPPDPDVTRRAHVALPLADLLPAWIVPDDGRPLAEIAAALVAPGAAPGTPPGTPPRARPDLSLRGAAGLGA